MAVYRQIHVTFWQDDFVLDLTPEEKYFYIYLMTNSKTSQCGIYELPKKVIEFETGYNRETVDKLMQRFIDYGKIAYDTGSREIFLKNWMKHNLNTSPKVKAKISKELQQIKTKEFISGLHTVLIQYGYHIDTESQKEEEKEEEKEKEKEKEEEKKGKCDFAPAADVTFNEIMQTYNENIHPITPIEADGLQQWMEDGMDAATIVWAIEQAATQGKRNAGYINGILRNLHAAGIYTADGAAAQRREWEANRKQKKDQEQKQEQPVKPRKAEKPHIPPEEKERIARMNAQLQQEIKKMAGGMEIQ